MGPPGRGGWGSAKRGIVISRKPPISHCGMRFHNVKRIVRCNIAYMVRCNITTMAVWSLCGATYPIRHVAVQHNRRGSLNRVGNMVRCNITIMAVWLYGAVQHWGGGYAGARVARVKAREDSHSPKISTPNPKKLPCNLTIQ